MHLIYPLLNHQSLYLWVFTYGQEFPVAVVLVLGEAEFHIRDVVFKNVFNFGLVVFWLISFKKLSKNDIFILIS